MIVCFLEFSFKTVGKLEKKNNLKEKGIGLVFFLTEIIKSLNLLDY